MKMSLWVLALLLLLTPVARADLFGLYDFTSLPGDETSVQVTAQPSDATLSAITRGSGVVAKDGANSINSRSWTNGTALDASDYYQFVVTPNSGIVLHLASLEFSDRRSDTGPRNIEVRFSLNDFATSTLLAGYSITDTANHREVLDLSGFGAVADLASAATFRIFAFNAVGTSNLGTYRLGIDTSSAGSTLPKNLLLTTSPEPSNFLVFGLGLVGAGCYGRHRRKRIAA